MRSSIGERLQAWRALRHHRHSMLLQSSTSAFQARSPATNTQPPTLWVARAGTEVRLHAQTVAGTAGAAPAEALQWNIRGEAEGAVGGVTVARAMAAVHKTVLVWTPQLAWVQNGIALVKDLGYQVSL